MALRIPFLIVLLLVGPVAALPAGHVDLAFSSPGQLVATLEGQFPVSEASFQRRLLDADGDGRVDQQEVDSATSATRASLADLSSGIGLPFGKVLVDGGEQTGSDVRSLRYEGAVGPVDATSALSVTWTLAVSFDVSLADNHTIVLDPLNFSRAGRIQMDVTSLVLQTPPGWRIAASGGLPLYATAQAGQAVFPAGLDGRVVLVLEQAPAAESPGWTPIVVGIGLVAALALRRRG